MALVAVGAAIFVLITAGSTPARVLWTVVLTPFMVWWTYSRYQQTRYWLHLADPTELRVAGPRSDVLVVPRVDVVKASIVFNRHWADIGFVPWRPRAHVRLVLSNGNRVDLVRFWQWDDKDYEDPRWRIDEVLTWAGKRVESR